MINLTALLKQDLTDLMRYSKDCKATHTGVRKNVGPVVAWNITKKCNFFCKHCYSSSCIDEPEKELSTDEVFSIIDKLKVIHVPVLLLSGGEPLMREDLFEIIEYCKQKGINVSLSTNGSLITREKAQKLKDLGVSYVGISLDGTETLNDRFRGVQGAFQMALKGIEACSQVGQKVGLRMTIHKENISEVSSILSLMKAHRINRICFYHLVPSGRGEAINNLILNHDQIRDFMDYLMDYTKQMLLEGGNTEILTVTNHTDGPYIYLKQSEVNPDLGASIHDKLSRSGGNRSGIGIMNIDWEGNVYPDQFSKFMNLGNILTEDVDTLWIKGNDSLNQLRNKRDFLNETCKKCKMLDICGGNLRARAYYGTGDLWGLDPSCYLKETEI